MEDEKQEEQTKTKKKKSCWIFGCLALIAFIFIALFLSRGFSIRSFSNYLDNIGRSQETKLDTNSKAKPLLSKTELVDYFIAAGLNPPKRTKISRWNKNTVTVAILGDATSEQIAIIDKFIGNFNGASKTVKLKRINLDVGDITIIMNEQRNDEGGAAGRVENAKCEIEHSVITMSELSGEVNAAFAAIFPHEMYHALGFGGHYQGKNCLLMSPKTCSRDPYGQNEKQLIEMLYNSGLPTCSDEAAIRQFFSK